MGVNAAAEIQELNKRLLTARPNFSARLAFGQASVDSCMFLKIHPPSIWGYVQLLAKKLEQSGKRKDG